jgi:nicotinamide-nucleotide amidase
MSNLPAVTTAEIVAVGSEMLGAVRVDTNSLYLAGALESLGISLRAKTVAGDHREELARIITGALERVDLLILTGGLGPTDDDVTREALADALGIGMREDPRIVESLQHRFASRGLTMPEVNRKQAMVPDGAEVLDNPLGSAPGLLLQRNSHIVVLLPGPPRELQRMFSTHVEPLLRARTGGAGLFRTSIFITGRTESHVEEIAQPLYSRWTTGSLPIETTILAAPGQIELHLSVRANDEATGVRRLTDAREQLVGALGPDVFSTDGRTMEQVVGSLLKDRNLTIAVAESCTGGLLQSRLTDVPGSSDWVLGGVVAYSNDAKTLFADVDASAIERHGAVSEPVASMLAEGIRTRMRSSIGVGITGIAGPSGGTATKPVGTVALAVSGPDATTQVRTVRLYGSRTQIKFSATQAALDMVRRRILS